MVQCFGREDEITYIRSQIEMYSSYRRIIYLQGEPYIGKTLLKNAIAEMIDSCVSNIDPSEQNFCPVQHAQLDCRSIHNGNLTEFQVVDDLYQQMKKWQNIKFPRYELARTYLFNKSNQTRIEYKVDDKEWSGGLVDIIFDALLDLTKEAINFHAAGSGGINYVELTAAAYMIKVVAKLPALKCVENLHDFFKKKFYESSVKEFAKDVQNLICDRNDWEIEAKLTECFWKDLQDYNHAFIATNVILLDTYELFSMNENNWIYSRLLRLSHGIFWIVFGTSPYAFDRAGEEIIDSLIKCPWPTLENRTRVWQIHRFSQETSRAMLLFYRVKGGNVIKTMVDLAHGLPGALRMLIDTYEKIINDENRIPTVEDFQSETRDDRLYQRIMEDVYVHHIKGSEKFVLCFLSELDEWDKDIYMFYAKENNIEFPDRLFDRLIKESIVQETGTGTYLLLDGPRAVFQNNNTKSEKQNAYRIAYKYFKMICDYRITNWSEEYGWDSAAYHQIQSNALKAVRYGVQQYNNASDFEELSSWLIVRPGSIKGIQQQLTDLKLYSLKEQLLEVYLSLIEERDSFKYDLERNAKYQLQAHYDLGWAKIYLHSYHSALKQILHRLHLGLVAHNLDSFSEENLKCIYSLGVIFQRWGRYRDSEFWHKVALEQRILAKATTEDGKRSKDNLIAISLNSYADAVMNNQRYEEAQKLFLQSLELRKTALKYNPLPEAVEERKKSPSAEHFRGIIATTGNMSKLYFLWGTHAKDYDILKKASENVQKCIEYCTYLYGDREDTALDHKVRLLTSEFQIDRLISGNHPNPCDFQHYISDYTSYIKYWESKSSDVTDVLHNLLNTKHNLSVVYAYTGLIEQALELNNTCITMRRSRLQATMKDNEKNILIELENLRILQTDDPSLEHLHLIF